MTLQNRVTPFGDIVADPARGTMMGNRGVLHDAKRTLGRARWRHANWIACELSFRGRKRTVMTPNRYTELFFLDEAVAFAAGHRPCGECRHTDYRRFMTLWAEHCTDLAPATAKEVDRALHRARIDRQTRIQRRIETALDDLPDGAFVAIGTEAMLVDGGVLRPYAPSGYLASIPRPSGTSALALTPKPLLRILDAGYRPRIALAT